MIHEIHAVLSLYLKHSLIITDCHKFLLAMLLQVVKLLWSSNGEKRKQFDSIQCQKWFELPQPSDWAHIVLYCTEFADFPDKLLPLPGQPIICGDFNCPGRDSASIDQQLSDMLISRSLAQFVYQLTYDDGSVPDLLITAEHTELLGNTDVHNPGCSDHKVVTVRLHAVVSLHTVMWRSLTLWHLLLGWMQRPSAQCLQVTSTLSPTSLIASSLTCWTSWCRVGLKSSTVANISTNGCPTMPSRPNDYSKNSRDVRGERSLTLSSPSHGSLITTVTARRNWQPGCEVACRLQTASLRRTQTVQLCRGQ